MISLSAISTLSLCFSSLVLWTIVPSCYFLIRAPFAHGLALPEQELINRRKSPALWREDLSIMHDDDHPNSNNDKTSLKLKRIQRPPEVMAPVGGWPQLHAAIANGADAVYVGLTAFSARARAANFDPVTELPQAVQTCHEAGVKLYVAMNTLVFPHELEEVEQLIRQCARANVDALIVQDLGVARLAQKVAPSVDIHASTQQTITSADGANFIAKTMGSTRVVLGRELSISEIEAVTQSLGQEDDSVEVETFVHGALCVSYSGQCFSSEFVGGRSANRGQCAQACRLPYGLIDNGELTDLGDFSYLLSPQDLCGLDHVPALVRANVACLKIEGRLKDASYVAATTRAYRNAVDKAWQEYLEEVDEGDDGDTAAPSVPVRQLSLPEEDVTKLELAQLFSRGQDEKHDGLSAGFFDGSQHQALVRGRSPRHRGVHVGRVLEGSSWKNGLIIALDEKSNTADKSLKSLLKRGDGLVVDRGMAQEEELGGPIYDVQTTRQPNGETVAHIRFSKSVEKKWKKLDADARKIGAQIPHVPVGAHVWKTSDATVDKKMKRLTEAPLPKTMQFATVSLTGKIGEPLTVTVKDGATGHKGAGISEGMLQQAEKELDDKAIQKAIGTLGNTDWILQGIETTGLESGAWCPASWIKEARRNAVKNLQLEIAGTPDSFVHKAESDKLGTQSSKLAAKQLLDFFAESNRLELEADASSQTKISVLARNYAQVDAVCNMVDLGKADDVDEVIVDFLEVEGMKEAVSRIRGSANVKVIVASPRIIKPGEEGIWRTLLRLQPDGLLVRSTGLLHRMMSLGGEGATVHLGAVDSDEGAATIPELIGDFSLNVANPLTAWELLAYGCSRVTASHDLNANGITDLLSEMNNVIESGASKIEIVAHAHMPIFHTEHCVFARFLSNGNSYLDCGHACTRHNIHLRDQSGADNLVLADMGCRNTVFASEAQSGVHSLKEWKAAGANRFRIELVDEGPSDVELIVSSYLSVINEEMRANAGWELLKEVRDSNGRTGGVTHGSLRNGVVRRAGEVS